jgi:hypothetical protein
VTQLFDSFKSHHIASRYKLILFHRGSDLFSGRRIELQRIAAVVGFLLVASCDPSTKQSKIENTSLALLEHPNSIGDAVNHLGVLTVQSACVGVVDARGDFVVLISSLPGAKWDEKSQRLSDPSTNKSFGLGSSLLVGGTRVNRASAAKATDIQKSCKGFPAIVMTSLQASY